MKSGSLFSGYAGLDIAVEAVTGATPTWFVEFEKAPSAILAHHWPEVPNLGDVTKVDWSSVEPVDIITGGFPCQDVSHAGKRAGLGAGTRTGLWANMLQAIDTIRPRLVVAENVRGLLSARADSDVEPCPWCVGDGESGSPVRALGAVLADLADIGYDAAWTGLRAADVGAPHGRFRVFIIAWPATDAPHAGVAPVAGALTASRGRAGNQPLRDGAALLTLLPTPVSDNSRGLPQKGTDYASLPNAVMSLLPTPAVNDMGAGKTPEAWDAWTERMKSAHGNGNGHGASLSIEALRMLPTPTAETFGTQHGNDPTRQTVYSLEAMAARDMFSEYAPAIARWERALGRPAPAPTEPTGKAGAHRLSPAFVEWMMGLPEGHVTDVGLTRNEQLKALGNGVVPQQAIAALHRLLTMRATYAAA